MSRLPRRRELREIVRDLSFGVRPNLRRRRTSCSRNCPSAERDPHGRRVVRRVGVGGDRRAVPTAPPAAPVASPPPEHPERRTWYATRAYAHAQLELVGTDAERRELAATILAMSEKITASYRTVEAPADVVPGPDLAALADEGEIRRLLANLRPQRSKLKNRPDRASDLAQVVAQITLLETKLKTRDGD